MSDFDFAKRLFAPTARAVFACGRRSRRAFEDQRQGCAPNRQEHQRENCGDLNISDWRVSPPGELASGLARGLPCRACRVRSMASVGGAVCPRTISRSQWRTEPKARPTTRRWSYSAGWRGFQDPSRSNRPLGPERWSDFSALGYARSRAFGDDAGRTSWLPPPMPAVDGINGKIDGYGGGGENANHTNEVAGRDRLPFRAFAIGREQKK